MSKDKDDLQLEEAYKVIYDISHILNNYFNKSKNSKKAKNSTSGISKKFSDSKSQKMVACNYCTETNLHWADTEYGWRLFHTSTGDQHKCLKKGKK